MPPDDIFNIIMVLIVGGFITVITIPFLRILAERLRVKGAAHAPEVQEHLDTLTGELEQTRRDVAELQERVDFAERVLAKQQGVERLPHP